MRTSVVLAALLVACTSSGNGTGGGDGGPAPSCSVPPGTPLTTNGYPASALPDGSCAGGAVCTLVVAVPCGRSDLYTCTCPQQVWGCEVTDTGGACVSDAGGSD
jgi:hypothetical protein